MELRLLGLAGYYRQEYHDLRQGLRQERLGLARAEALAQAGAGLIGMAITATVLGWMLWRALHGQASVIAARLGFAVPAQSSGGGSDGNFTGAMGIPTLDGLGVMGALAHTLEEHIFVDSLAYRGKLFAGLLQSV